MIGLACVAGGFVSSMSFCELPIPLAASPLVLISRLRRSSSNKTASRATQAMTGPNSPLCRGPSPVFREKPCERGWAREIMFCDRRKPVQPFKLYRGSGSRYWNLSYQGMDEGTAISAIRVWMKVLQSQLSGYG